MDFLERLDLKTFKESALRVPYERVDSHLFQGVELWVRRDDQLDPLLSGNKAYKLLFNLLEATERGVKTVATCGGAWSNHIHATAAAGARFGFSTLGIIRGERPPSLSAMLEDAQRLGMQLVFVSRAQYRRRGEATFLREIGLEENSILFVPEGGSNWAGVKGAGFLGQVISESQPVDFDQLWVACGTGATFAGLGSTIKASPVVGVEILKAGASVATDSACWLERLGMSRNNLQHIEGVSLDPLEEYSRLRLLSGFHCGGYGKYPEGLKRFQVAFERDTGIPLDPVYTSKLFMALSYCVVAGKVPVGSRVLAIHTGGLQGRRGYR
ncbi:1-aminocyclopropane-1-carboxylate deaminase/D-cysteine desulfhydrase [Microbulbifer sp. SSSA008]|uniref:1-aminocyclopropane-1-carboxylate deaminase/D-cysteine desulfhydrase n=1 Tax=Microbulbifer sp. SSSA008 TaxID=3243380 RepID=UPI00403A4597